MDPEYDNQRPFRKTNKARGDQNPKTISKERGHSTSQKTPAPTAKEAFNLLSDRPINKDLINKEGEGKGQNDNFKVKQFRSGLTLMIVFLLTFQADSELFA